MTAEPAPVRQRIIVSRGRHGWPLGYFDSLVGERIPFPSGGRQPGRPLTGVLVSVLEDPLQIELLFEAVALEEPS